MISLTCTTCKNVLSIDDAFAGGVCRCQHCGTIQTVPSHLKHGKSVSGVEPKMLYKHRSRAESAAGTGLHELADVVASSGLARSGLREKPTDLPADAPAPAKRESGRTLLYTAALVIAVLIGIIIWMTFRAG